MWELILQAICEAEGERFHRAGNAQSVSGGCINQASVLKLIDEAGRPKQFFVKVNTAPVVEQFSAEAEGLDELRRPEAIRVPRPVCHGMAEDAGFLVLEYVDLGGGRTSKREAQLGKQLADLHRTLATDRQFGWIRDNAIGATPQVNTQTSDWLEFFVDHRLRVQFGLAKRKGAHFSEVDAFLDQVVPSILSEHRPSASLLHGDLWGGNVGYDEDGHPVVFDPAVYFGDRETDLAFTHMFGGFGPAFYQSYERAWPLPAGHQLRSEL